MREHSMKFINICMDIPVIYKDGFYITENGDQIDESNFIEAAQTMDNIIDSNRLFIDANIKNKENV